MRSGHGAGPVTLGTDLVVDRRMLLIRGRKDPRNKTGNDQRIPLFTAWALVTGHKDCKMRRRYPSSTPRRTGHPDRDRQRLMEGG